jgi:hypothetical protein
MSRQADWEGVLNGCNEKLTKRQGDMFSARRTGAWCSTVSTSVSKTEGLGSIPSAPAIRSTPGCSWGELGVKQGRRAASAIGLEVI